MDITTTEYFIKPLAGIALDRLVSFLSTKYKQKVSLKAKDFDILDAYDSHLNYINNWSSEVSFNYAKKPKGIHSVYIALKFYLNPVYTQFFEEKPEDIEITELVGKTNRNIVVLGYPGAGKSTSVKFLCQDIIFNEDSKIKSNVPILIKFRDLSDKRSPSIFNEILNIFSLSLIFDRDDDSLKESDILKNSVVEFLNQLEGVMLLFDGFDEISNYDIRTNLINELRTLSDNLNPQRCRFILTSRTGEFKYTLTNTTQFQIAPLSEKQIKQFVSKWIKNKERSKDFLNQIKDSPFYDTTVRPLTIAHLCAIFERYDKIPDQPKTVYELIVNLLLRDWSEQWSVKRDTGFSKFEIPRKAEFLSQMAYLLTTKFFANRFNTGTLQECYKIMSPNFSLPIEQANIVIQELESHTGLFIQAGYDKFEFPHKSIQEYLAAKYLNSIPLPTQGETIQKIPNELAIATSISINPTLYLYSIVFDVFRNKALSIDYYIAFLNRLIIERPFFTLSPILALSILFIIREYIKLTYSKLNNNETVGIRKMIDLPEEHFAQLLSEKIVQNSFAELQDYYVLKGYVKKYNLVGEFIQFKRIKEFNDEINHYNVPKTIEVPKWIEKYCLQQKI